MWKKVNPQLRHKISDKLWQWLIDTGSLTERLKSAAKGQFEVRVMHLDHERPMWSERQALGLPDRQRALVRHVLLLGEGRPWVFARTVIPMTSLDGPLRHLAYLGDKPLGAALFSDCSLFRSDVEIAEFHSGHDIFDEASLCSEFCAKRIWGRRSVFRLQGKPLLVSELFLPGIPSGCS